MATPVPQAAPSFPPEMFARPTSVFVWGDDRLLLNQLVYHLARVANPEFTWVEIRGSTGPAGPGDPGNSTLVPEKRRVLLKADQLRPQIGRNRSFLTRVLKTDRPNRVLAELLLFLQLPAVIQPVLGRMVTIGPAPVLAVSNSDRIAEFYPPEADVVEKFVGALVALHLTLIVSYCGPERPDKHVWEHVFHVVAGPAGATITRERGPPLPEWPVGRLRSIEAVDGFVRAREELTTAPAARPRSSV